MLFRSKQFSLKNFRRLAYELYTMFPPSGAQPLTFDNYNSYVPVEDLFLRASNINALVNLIPHYPPPGLIRAFDKGINERPFSQGGAFDTAAFDECWLKSGL